MSEITENEDDIVFEISPDEQQHEEAAPEEKKKGGLFSRKKKKKSPADEDDDYDFLGLGVEIDDEPEFIQPQQPEIPAEEETFDEYMAALTWNHSAQEPTPEEPVDEPDSFLSRLKSKRAEKVSGFSTKIDELEEPKQPDTADEKPENIGETQKIQSSQRPVTKRRPRSRRAALDEINQVLVESGLSPLDEVEEPEQTAIIPQTQTVQSAAEIEPAEVHIDEPAEEIEDISSSTKPIKADEDGQLTFENFDDEFTPEISSEAVASSELRERREKKISAFHVETSIISDEPIIEEETHGTADITEDAEQKDGESVFAAVERTAKEKLNFFKASIDRKMKDIAAEHVLTVKEVEENLAKQEKKTKILLPVTIILAAALIIISFLPSFYDEGLVLDGFIGHGGRKFVLVNIILYVLTLVCGFGTIKDAFVKLGKGIKGANLFYLATNAIVVLSLIATLCAGINENGGLVCYSAVGAMSVLCAMLTRKRENETLKKSLNVIHSPELNGLQPIKNSNDSGSLGYDLSKDGNPTIYYSADAVIPNDVLGLSNRDEGNHKKAFATIIASIVFGAVLCIVTCIIRKSAMPLCTVIPCTVLLALPVFRPFVLSLFKAKTNKRLYLDKATILAADECDEMSKLNSVVVDASEIVDVSISKFKKFPEATMRKTDALIFTAAILINTKSLMSYCFDGYIESLNIPMPEVESVVYEEGLGFSGWVNGTKVLIGNRKCLQTHSIYCPTEREEKKYAEGGDLLYTVIGGKIVASFIVSYKARPGVETNLRAWIKTTAVIMVNSQEPTLTEEKLAALTGTTSAIIKIVGLKGFEIIDAARADTSDRDENGLIFSKRKNSTLSVALGVFTLAKERKISKTIQTLANIVICIIFTLFAVTSLSASFTPIVVILLQAISSIISYYVGKSADLKK